MKHKSIFFVIMLSTFLGWKLFFTKTIIDTKLTQLQLFNYYKSINGYFLLTLNDDYSTDKVSSELIAFDNTGKLLFNRLFQNKSQNIFSIDFKEVSKGLYSYFLTQALVWHTPATIHFLNKNFHDLILPISTIDDPDLDCHDVIKTQDGNFILIFSRKGLKDQAVNPEVQIINPNGKIIFSWKVFDHINIPDSNEPNADPLHLNSISMGEKNEIFLSLSYTGEILKIEYPSGKILAHISRKDWTFAKDSRSGFNGQHSISYLGKNRILLFDNLNGNNFEKARAVEYELDFRNKIATLVWEFKAHFPEDIHRRAGSVQRLSNGNTLINWGTPLKRSTLHHKFIIFTEVSPDGKIIRELFSTKDLDTYRVSFKEN